MNRREFIAAATIGVAACGVPVEFPSEFRTIANSGFNKPVGWMCFLREGQFFVAREYLGSDQWRLVEQIEPERIARIEDVSDEWATYITNKGTVFLGEPPGKCLASQNLLFD